MAWHQQTTREMLTKIYVAKGGNELLKVSFVKYG